MMFMYLCVLTFKCNDVYVFCVLTFKCNDVYVFYVF